MTTTDYLTQLTKDRQDLVDNLETKGISGLSGDETFTELVPEVLNIPSGGGAWEVPDGTLFMGSTWENAPLLDTHNVTNAYRMFQNCTKMKTISQLDTSNITNMRQMFSGCSVLGSVPNLNVSSCSSFSGMFDTCLGLENIELSNSTCSSNSTYFSEMFANCENLKSAILPALGQVGEGVNCQKMFHDCRLLETVDLSNFNPVSFKNTSYMFYNCWALRELDISSMTVFPNDNFDNMFYSVPGNCLILVKDQNAVDWFTTNFPTMTNVQIKN